MTPAAILGATFTIAFEGLMMFHNPPSGISHLAIVDAMYHTPMIYVYHHGNPDPEPVMLYQGDRVSFENVPMGKFKADALFKEHVPTLNEYLVRGHVRDDVGDEVFRPGVWAYVDLPAGVMTTWHNFKDAVQLTRNTQPAIVCFARFAVLGPLRADNATISFHHVSPAQAPGSYQIRDGDVLIISNISQDTTHLHFPEYAQLLNRDAIIGGMSLLYGGCDAKEESDSVDPDVGKILTNHSPTPNGDCGPTGNP